MCLRIGMILIASLAAIPAPAVGSPAWSAPEPKAPFDAYRAESGSDLPPRSASDLAPASDSNDQFDLSLRPLPLVGTMEQSVLRSVRPTPSNGRRFATGFAMIGGFEVSLLVGTMMMPRSFTGWQDDFFQDGMANLGEAWTRPPVWDTDHWFHNYVGHPYGGNVYYNTLRSRGGTVSQSFLFSAAMSTWWEYALEAVAERPSIQDLFVTPVAGSVLGEFTHRMALRMKRNGTSGVEKLLLTVLNPTHVIFLGYR